MMPPPKARPARARLVLRKMGHGRRVTAQYIVSFDSNNKFSKFGNSFLSLCAKGAGVKHDIKVEEPYSARTDGL
jgi:hypothetical protein